MTGPMVEPNGEFNWRRWGGSEGLVCLALSEIAPHIFTTRHLAIGVHERAPRCGYEAVARQLLLRPGQIRDANQVHGAAAFIVDSASEPCERPDADILATADSGVGLVVRVADCVPILLGDRRTGAVAAVHAGWRGTRAGAAMTAVDVLDRRFGCRGADLVAAIGPSIGPCCYQVGPSTYGAFEAATDLPPVRGWFLDDGDRWRLDLWRANRDQLIAAGVPADAIHIARECTAHTPARYFSYRRDGASAGRLLAAIRPRAGMPDLITT